MQEITSNELKRELRKLSVRGLSLLVEKGEQELFTSQEGGLKPLLEAIGRLGERMAKARVLDKVVGGAAAKLLVYAQVGEVFTFLASQTAVETLQAAGIPLGALKVVKQILGKGGKPCPFEALAERITDPAPFLRELSRQMG